ncbi:MAG: class I SAM-dependent methyltransferase [Thiohalomonadales bacterium]
MNELEKYFTENTNRSIHKWQHYFYIYDRYFSRFRGTDVHVVEFGVSEGGSLQMWKEYFGPACKIYGVDINPLCKELEEDGIQIFIGDQEDRKFLRSLAKEIPRIDILIDDGGHRMGQQINTFEELFPVIDENGVYLCEDMHTSYWKGWGGGGYKKKGTFIEYCKNFIDYINAWHSQTSKLSVLDFTKSARSLHFYDSVLVIEKEVVDAPYHLRTGEEKIKPYRPPKDSIRRRIRRLFKFRGRRPA